MPPLDLSQLDLTPRHLTVLRALLERHVPDAEVRAFGSRVSGGSHASHEGSDLDLVLHNARDPALFVDGRAMLCEALHASALPMLVEVHDDAQLPNSFHQAIARRYVVVQTPMPQAQKDAVR